MQSKSLKMLKLRMIDIYVFHWVLICLHSLYKEVVKVSTEKEAFIFRNFF
jgi:hypothetical protein